ncbi:unnamed protein product [Nezara viridula]|uniref:Uncharacterized protein n=1 Tax=Nezara viridula TaxID=85310 RepID=A0A9P0DV35_NEZVI|nr:unnamed protein product [Nezara viridula]
MCKYLCKILVLGPHQANGPRPLERTRHDTVHALPFHQRPRPSQSGRCQRTPTAGTGYSLCGYGSSEVVPR